jgi:5'-methylthioadenosine phosphorylase
MEGLTDVLEISVETPFGMPSDNFILGTLDGVRVAFLARHGRGHRLTPTELPFRANIYAMKLLGVERILSASAVGSLQEQYAPTDIVIPDQFFDRTRGRVSTFFGEGVVAHITFAHPVCGDLCNALGDATEVVGVKVHRGGTYLCMEGPAFSTLAESRLYRSWGMDVIGMTNLQEAKLAREAEICYATMALVTDYDCWHPDHDAVTVELVIEYLNKNSTNAQKIIRHAVGQLAAQPRQCKCGSALKHAILTHGEIPAETKKKLAAIIGKYVGE